MKPESDLLAQALSNLPPHFLPQGDHHPPHTDHNNETTITLGADDQRLQFEVVIKIIHRKESLAALLPTAHPQRLLVCNPLTDFLADYCTEHLINFIDTAGNARINAPGLTLWITGKQLQNQSTGTTTDTGARMSIGTMKLLFVLLTHPEIRDAPYRELNVLAGISLGMVSKGYTYLKKEGYVRASGKHHRFMNEEELSIQWLRDYRTVLRPKLGGIQLTAPQQWRDIPLLKRDVWGGEVAADQLTNYLQPEQWQLFTSERLQQRIAQLGLRPTNHGTLWLVPAFWGEELQIDEKAQALLAVAELLTNGDSRNIEAAEIINEQYLHLKTLPTRWI